MDWFAKAFLKSALVWLALGVTLGVVMAVRPEFTVYRPAHLHMLLLGFVAMMINGVAYHVVPRFVGQPLFSSRAPGWHWFAANIGLVCMVAGFLLRANALPFATAALATGGTLSAAGAYTFAYVLWRTMDAPLTGTLRTVTIQRPDGKRGAPTA